MNGSRYNSSSIPKFIETNGVTYEKVDLRSIKAYTTCEKTTKVPMTTSGYSSESCRLASMYIRFISVLELVPLPLPDPLPINALGLQKEKDTDDDEVDIDTIGYDLSPLLLSLRTIKHQ